MTSAGIFTSGFSRARSSLAATGDTAVSASSMRPSRPASRARMRALRANGESLLTRSFMRLAHVGFGGGAERHGVLDVLVQEVELELGADRVVEEDLVASVLDVLLLELDVELLQFLAELHGAGCLPGDVVDAAAVLVLHE